MNYKKVLKNLLLEKGAKKADGLEIYYFLKPPSLIVDKNGWKYTVAKVELEPKVLIHCYRCDLDPEEEDKYIVISGKDFKKYYKVA